MTKLGVLTVLALLLAGCASGSSGGSAPASRVVVSDADNGRTVTLHRGQELVLRLHSTYWDVSSPAAGLTLTSKKVVPARGHCVPGQGCGTVTAVFRAAAKGHSAVAAHRRICGEAMLCVGAAGRYRLSVVVG